MKITMKKWLTLALVATVLTVSIGALAEETPATVLTSATVNTVAPTVTPAPQAPPAAETATQAEAPADTGTQNPEETAEQPEATASDTASQTETPANTQTPEQTETPTQTPADNPEETATTAPEEETPAPTDELAEATPEPTDTPAPVLDVSQVSIDVRCVSAAEVRFGDTITVIAEVHGLEGIPYTLQWQYGNGSEWHNQDGATTGSYSFALSKTNACYQWRVVVTVAQ